MGRGETRMSRHARGVLAGAAFVLLTGLVALWIYPRDSVTPDQRSTARAPGGFVVAPPEPVAPPPAPPIDEQVATVMAAWRTAIVGRDTETVLTCDRTFVTDARTFTPALVQSAQSDGDERVRAFSTRVLGKFADPALIEVFRKLLADGSPFVRENAAWSLGELRDRASGVTGDLEKVRKGDQVEAVRRAATEALHRVRGGAVAQRRAG